MADRRRQDWSYGPEYGPLPPEYDHGMYDYLPSRGRVPWPVYHGEGNRGFYPFRLLEQRVTTEHLGLSRLPLQPYAPLRILNVNGGGGGNINPRPRPDNPGLTEDEFKAAMDQLKQQTYEPSKPHKPASSSKGGGGIFKTRCTKTTHKETPNTDEEKACIICLETFVPQEQVVVTPCNHMFHQGCITPWLKGHGNCPVCRFMLCERRNVVDNSNGNGDDSEAALEVLAMMSAMEEAFSRVTLSSFMSYH